MLGARLFELDYRISRWLRYPLVISRTLLIFLTERPRIIFAQNPSLLLALLAVTYGIITGKTVIIDAHNAGLFPLEGKFPLLNRIAACLPRQSSMTIVSNAGLTALVAGWGGHAVAIPDPFPTFGAATPARDLKGTFNILYICSWSTDEPVHEVIEAARHCDQDICIYITGNNRGVIAPEALPRTVELTGYIAEHAFTNLLFGCDAVMVLTTRENCLLCGAYEGVAAGKPLILSATRALQDYFNGGSVFVENSATAIRAGIDRARREHDRYAGEVCELRRRRDSEYNQLITDFNRQIERLQTTQD